MSDRRTPMDPADPTAMADPADRATELACDSVLFGLSDAERAERQALVDGDAAAHQALKLELVAGELSALTPIVQMPSGLREKLIAQIEGGARLSGPAPQALASASPSAPGDLAVTAVRRRGPSRFTAFAGYVAAVAAVLLAVLAWPGSIEPPLPPPTPLQARAALLALQGTITLPFAATPDEAARGASGDVIWHSGVQRGFMRIRGLARNEPGVAQYQLWIFDAARDARYPVDGGVFDVGPEGEVIVPITAKLDVRDPSLFAITVEKPGGVVVSDRERIVLAAKRT